MIRLMCAEESMMTC